MADYLRLRAEAGWWPVDRAAARNSLRRSGFMRRITRFLASNAAEGTWVGLMCARGQQGFYERFGFRARPSDAPGMQMRP